MSNFRNIDIDALEATYPDLSLLIQQCKTQKNTGQHFSDTNKNNTDSTILKIPKNIASKKNNIVKKIVPVKKNHTEDVKKVVPIEKNHKEDVTEDVKKVVPIEKNHKEDVTEDVKKVIPIEKNHKEDVTEDVKKVIPIEKNHKEDVTEDVKKVVPIEKNHKEDVTEDVKKVVPIEKNHKEDVPVKKNNKEDVTEDAKKVVPVKKNNKEGVTEDAKKVVPVKKNNKEGVTEDAKKVVPVKKNNKKCITENVKKVANKLQHNNDNVARKNRGLTQKIFMIEHRKNSTLDIEFDVMGTTRNVYTVRIAELPTCTCPDYMTRNSRCKHIYFVLRRIMKIHKLFSDNTAEEFKKYTKTQLKKLIENMPDVMKELVVNDSVKSKYKNLKNKKTTNIIEMKDLDDICCVCFDDLKNGDDIDYCRSNCGKPVHAECFKMVSSAKNKPTCLMCGNLWIVSDTQSEESYINLS